MMLLPGDLIRISHKGKELLKKQYPDERIERMYGQDLIISEVEGGEQLFFVCRDFENVRVPECALSGYIEPVKPKPPRSQVIRERMELKPEGKAFIFVLLIILLVLFFTFVL